MLARPLNIKETTDDAMVGKPREDDPLSPAYVQFERFRAAQYSRELSDKVWRGCVKITEQGYWAGGSPPYGTRRLLLDEKREPLQPLEPGQRKGIQNQRVTLVEGDLMQVAVIQRIFHEFVDLGYSEYQIAEGLNADGILSPSGRRWGAGSVLGRLQNETHIGTLAYNKTTQKLKTPRRHNPPDKWVRSPEAFEGLVTTEQFARARKSSSNAVGSTTRTACWTTGWTFRSSNWCRATNGA